MPGVLPNGRRTPARPAGSIKPPEPASSAALSSRGREMPPAPLPPQAARREEEFQWQPENEDIVVPEQNALAIYVNPWGQIVLRQEGEFREDDAWVRINIESVPQVI